MVTQLIQHERIETTVARAKQLRKIADRMVTFAKKGGRSARIEAAAVVRTERERHKLFTTLAERYAAREGGYTRVLRTRVRTKDAAEMAYIEFVDRDGELRPARPPAALRGHPLYELQRRLSGEGGGGAGGAAAAAAALPTAAGAGTAAAPAAALVGRQRRQQGVQQQHQQQQQLRSYSHLPASARAVLEQRGQQQQQQERRWWPSWSWGS